MEPEPKTLSEATPTGAPADCGHHDWVVGCERCFYEVKGIANDNIRASVAEAQMEGAILFNWHVLMTVADMETQLAPLTQSLDLTQVRLGKDLMANLKALRVYLISLGANPGRMEQALRKAASVAVEVQRLQKEYDAASAATPTSSIILTDKVA